MQSRRFLSFVIPVLLVIAAAMTVSAPAFAQEATATVPRLITFSGTLGSAATEVGENGVVIAPATAPTKVVAVTFSLYSEETGGAPLWSEVQNVHVDGAGHYTIQLGASKPDGLPIDIFASVQAHWLGVQPQGSAELPRVLLVSVPYALKSADAETFGGLPPSAYILAPSTETNPSPTKGTGGAGTSGKGSEPPAVHLIYGNGTPGYIPIWSTFTTMGNSVLYQNLANGKMGVGTTTPFAKFDVSDNNNSGYFALSGTTSNSAEVGTYGNNLAPSGNGIGTAGHALSPTGIGVFGFHDSKTGAGIGVSGLTNSSSGTGVLGAANTPTGSAFGVSGASASVDGVGVAGLVTSTGGKGHKSFGVEGTAQDPNGAGGSFGNLAVTGPAVGVSALSEAYYGRGVLGVAYGQSHTASQFGTTFSVGVWGDTATSDTGVGVLGTADDATAIDGENNSTTGPAGAFLNSATSGSYQTLVAQSNSPASVGVYGVNAATSGSGFGVEGTTTTPNGAGVYGLVNLPNGNAVLGHNQATTGPAVGVAGESDGASGIGVLGAGGAGGAGVYGIAGSGAGSTAGLFLNSGGGYILVGVAQVNGNPKFSVQGDGSGFFAGALQVNGNGTFGPTQVNGNLNVTGTLTKGGGSFKIDDPIDPANKYLSHSFVESPDMMNIYNGVVRLDARGEAWVVLPTYFEALNRDFRYQLTSVGSPQPRLYIAREVDGNRFKISGGRANGKVSWQVTGVRQDAWANAHRIPNEEDKPLELRGKYLYPESYVNKADERPAAIASLKH